MSSGHSPKPTQTAVTMPCPQCHGTMVLSRIEPDKPGYDRRTFECPKCLRCETVTVKYR